MSTDTTAVSDQVAEPTTTESAPVENNSNEAEEVFANALNDDLEAPKEEPKGEAEETQIEEPAAEEPKPEEQPQGEEEKPLTPKSENRFQTLANRAKEAEQKLNDPEFLRKQLESLQLQDSQLATESELINEINPETGDYYTPQEAQRIAFLQSREQQQQNITQQREQLTIQQNQQNIESEIQEVLQMPMFNPFVPGTEQIDPTTGQMTGTPNPDYSEADAQQAATLLERSLIRSDTIPEIGLNGQPTGKGMVIGSNLSPNQIFQTIADSANRAAEKAKTIGQAEAQKATNKMLANADVPGGTSPSKKNSDPILDALNSD